jgi:hypothetical protein
MIVIMRERRSTMQSLPELEIKLESKPMRAATLLILILAPSLAGAQTDRGAHAHAAAPVAVPTEPGQAAFAAIAEIVSILEADPETDWSRVDIEALRQHLIDMHAVTLNAAVTVEPVENGWRFTVSGEGRTREAIRRMTLAHAAVMGADGPWRFEAEERPEGAALTVRADDPAEVGKIRALGFVGVMTAGMHHQTHHLMIARGGHPHD